MAIKPDSIPEEPGKQVDAKTEELIKEFHDHYLEYIKLHPESKDRKDDIFQSWVIQKIAGLQLSIMEVAGPSLGKTDSCG